MIKLVIYNRPHDLDLSLPHSNALLPSIFFLNLYSGSTIYIFLMVLLLAPLSVPQFPVQACHLAPIENELEIAAHSTPVDM